MSNQSAKFVQGSTMRHILVMSGTASIGLMALFVVDLLDMFFISMLGQVELAAAIGFAGTIIFFSTSVSIGSSIAMGALVFKALGAKENDTAKQLASSTLVIAFIVNSVITLIMFCFIPELLAMIGAKGVVAERAQAYLSILLPSTPIIAMAAGVGVLYGQALGNIVFGIISIIALRIHVVSMVKEHCQAVSSDDTLADISVTMTPFCNNDAVIMQSGVEEKKN